MKTLGALLEEAEHPSLRSVMDIPIKGLAVDSRLVKPGDLFVAMKGVHHDGHDHAAEVVRAGAVAIVAERPLTVPVPVVVVKSTAVVLSGLAARFFDHPSRFMDVVGVTGTQRSAFSSMTTPTGRSQRASPHHRLFQTNSDLRVGKRSTPVVRTILARACSR